MPGFRWLAGSLLVGLSIYICACNIAILRARYRHEYHSFIPLIGGLLGMAALLVLPVHVTHRWFWVPFIADLGSVLCFVTLGHIIAKKVLRL
jgi:hypothetical protein